MSETLKDVKRIVFDEPLRPSEIERMNAIQEAIMEGISLNRIPGQQNPESGRERY